MKKYEVVKNNRDFEKIISKKKCVKNNDFIIYYIDNMLTLNRFGISVGKKIGNAVERNYYKRIIRNICDIEKKLYSKNKDYIIIMRKGCLELDFDGIKDSLSYLIKKINKEKENEYEKKDKV